MSLSQAIIHITLNNVDPDPYVDSLGRNELILLAMVKLKILESSPLI